MHGVSPLDPTVFAGVPALLIAVAMLAAWVPAFRGGGHRSAHRAESNE